MAKYEADILNPGYSEHLIAVRPTGKVRLARVAILLGAAALTLLLLALTLMTIPTVSFIAVVLVVFVAWFLWQFTKVEYEYTIATGELELCRIYGARVRKTVLTFKTADLSAVFPASRLSAERKDVKDVLYACNRDDPNAYALLYAAKDGVQKALVVAVTEKTKACLKYYRRSVVTE